MLGSKELSATSSVSSALKQTVHDLSGQHYDGPYGERSSCKLRVQNVLHLSREQGGWHGVLAWGRDGLMTATVLLCGTPGRLSPSLTPSIPSKVYIAGTGTVVPLMSVILSPTITTLPSPPVTWAPTWLQATPSFQIEMQKTKVIFISDTTGVQELF